jgi:hypothetical protein
MDIACLNTQMGKEEAEASIILRSLAEWAQIRLQELTAAHIQYTALKNDSPKNTIEQFWHPRNFKVEKINWGEHVRVINAWQYFNHFPMASMLLEYHHQLQQIPSFVHMEYGKSPHTAIYTSQESKNRALTNWTGFLTPVFHILQCFCHLLSYLSDSFISTCWAL